MAALVQSFPTQQSPSPVSLMQPRPQSASNSLQSAQAQSSHSNQHHLTTPRNMGGYNSSSSSNSNNSGNNTSGYRSGYTTAPVAPYAFTSTPSLSNTKQQPPKIGERTSSKPDDSRNRYPAPDSISSSSSSSTDPSSRHQGTTSSAARDDALQYSRPNTRPLSTISTSNLPPPQMTTSTNRPSPDRYRRPGNRRSESAMSSQNASAQPSGSGMASVAAIYSQPRRSESNPSLPHVATLSGTTVKASSIGDYAGQLRSQTVDDIHMHKHLASTSQQQMQNRRKSVGPDSFSPDSFQNFVRQEMSTMATPVSIQLSRPGSATSASSKSQTNEGSRTTGSANFQPSMRPGGSRRAGSTDSSNSANSSRPTSSNRNSVHSASSNAASSTAPHEINPSQVPPRGSSTDMSKRITAPSPLSKPMSMSPETLSSFPEPQSASDTVPGPVTKSATEQLEALSDPPKKGMKNRLRRAFSFGSAAELRKVSAVNNMRGEEAAERARLRQERFREEQNAEQLRVVRRQEEAGLGEGIYSGQGNFFTGSTDNISVSSTASSASIMIRKMGKGMKKSTRSLVGLFRPKSVVGVPAASGPVTAQASTGQVSMVTVEAERERENIGVNADARDPTGGGTDFPKLEGNLPETCKAGEASTVRRGSNADDADTTKKSLIAGDKERAEILARKGILKRAGSSSPIIKPTDPSNTVSGSENQKLPLGKQRSDSLKIEGDDYFISGPRFATGGSSASAPTSPASMTKFNVSFSPRITFHDTWPSGEYDRRGEIATCNRLTPMLAQQIKEELNTFKMEMDVHEESKVYTHFF